MERAESCHRSQRASCPPSLKMPGVFLEKSMWVTRRSFADAEGEERKGAHERSWANSKSASLYRQRRITEATLWLQNFKRTLADPISLCGHLFSTETFLNDPSDISGVLICLQLYIFTKEDTSEHGLLSGEHTTLSNQAFRRIQKNGWKSKLIK